MTDTIPTQKPESSRSAEPNELPEGHGKRYVVVNAVRWSLYAAIAYTVVSLGVGIVRLGKPSTDPSGDLETPVVDTNSDTTAVSAIGPELSFLDGFWSSTEGRFGCSVSRVTEDELARLLEFVPESEVTRTAATADFQDDFEVAVFTLADALKLSAVPCGQFHCFAGERSGFRYRLLVQNCSEPQRRRIQLLQICWPAESDQWNVAQLSLAPEILDTRKADGPTWLPGLESPLAIRYSTAGDVTGAVFPYPLPFSELVSQCTATGRKFVVEEQNDELLAGTLESGAGGSGMTVICTRVAGTGLLFLLNPSGVTIE